MKAFTILHRLISTMKVTITYLELKNPFSFFALSYNAMKILQQLKSTPCVEMKKKGMWTKHYTMTLWNAESELKDFSKSGAHLNAMKQSAKIAKEIRTITVDMDKLPDWKTAEELLANAKPLKY